MPQLDDEAKAKDAAEITVDRSFQPKRKTYRVTAVGGLFKNGQQIDPGNTVELDDRTAAGFLALDEVELVAGQDEAEGENE